MWTGLVASMAAVPLLWGIGPGWGVWASLLACFVCFATFCLLYDEPVRKARSRVAARLAGMSSRGSMSEEYQRLQSSRLNPTDAERKMTMSPMLIANLVSGAAGAGLALWGLALRIS
jgi:hypothetical protein